MAQTTDRFISHPDAAVTSHTMTVLLKAGGTLLHRSFFLLLHIWHRIGLVLCCQFFQNVECSLRLSLHYYPLECIIFSHLATCSWSGPQSLYQANWPMCQWFAVLMTNTSEDFSDARRKPASNPAKIAAALAVHLERVALSYDVINYLFVSLLHNWSFLR